MNRYLKWTAIAFLILIVLVAGGAAAVRVFVSSDRMKNLAASYGSEFLGRKLKLESISVGLFVTEVSGLTVEGKDGKEPLLRIRKIKALLNPAAILYKKISILSLDIEGIKIRASRDAAGRLSFQDLLDRLNPSAARDRAATGPSNGAESKSEYDFVIRDLDISGLSVRFESAASGGIPAFRANCDFATIEIDKVRLKQPIPVEVAGKCSEPGAVEISLDAKLDLDAGRYELAFTFQPFDVMPFVRLAPPAGRVRLTSGTLGGKIKISAEPGKGVSWDSDLTAENIAARLLLPGKGDWRRKELSRVRLKSTGNYNVAENSARISGLEAELPFLKLRLNQEALWNSEGRDRLDFDLNVENFGLAAKWFASIWGFSLKIAKDGGHAVLSLSANRIRDKVDGLNVSASVKFGPIDVAPYMALVPQGNLRRLRGRLGGSLEASYAASGATRWKADLRGDDLAVQLRAKPGKRWRKIKLASAVIRSEGAYDMVKDSGEISALDVKLPFGEMRISKKAVWNISEKDAMDLTLTVSDIGAAAGFASAVSGLPIKKGDVQKGGKLDMKLALSRSHRENAPVSVKGSVSLDPIQVEPFAALAPESAGVRNLRGVMGGKVDFSFEQGGRVTWKADLSGKKISGKADFGGGGQWSGLALESFQLGTDGWYDLRLGSARVSRLEAGFPFGTVKLLKEARWNLSGKDEAEFAVKISDIGAVAQLTSAVSGLSIKKGDVQKGAKLDMKLALSRSHRENAPLSVKGSLSLDPIQVEPFAALVPESAGVRNLRGVLGGKVSFSFRPGERVSWRANLSGEKVTGKVDFDGDKKWGVLGLKTFQIASDGWYSLRLGSARVSRLDARIPFGSLKLLKEARWNISGRDEFALAWDLSDLGAAAAFAGAIAGGSPLPVAPVGSAMGSVVLSRDRKKSDTFSMRGSAEAVLKRVHFSDYPNMEVEGKAGIRVDGNILNVSVPALIVRDRRRRQSPALLDIRGFKTAISQKDLMNGRFVAEKARAGTLRINFSMDSKKNSNLRRILAPPEKPGLKKARMAKRPARKGGEAASSRPKVSLPDIDIRRMDIGSLDFRFSHQVEASGRPVVLEWKNLNLQIRNLNTRMKRGRLNGRISLVSRARPVPFSFEAKMNPALDPPELEGRLSLYRFDLARLSPYALSARGIKIQRGKLDLKSTFSLRGGYLSSRISVKARKLDLRQVKKREFLDKAHSVLQRLALKLLKRKNDVISLKFKVEGRLNDPSFNTGQALTSALLSGVIRKLTSIPGTAVSIGGKVGDLLKGILGGIGGIISPEKEDSSGDTPGDAPKEDAPRQDPLQKTKDALKEVGKDVKDILRGLFGR
jgi:hypothetical protein